MSQNTRCPACQTLFKVVPDQLRVSEGWVRCGQCSEIFDAHSHLYKEPFAPEFEQHGSAAQHNSIDAPATDAHTTDSQATEPARLPGLRELEADSIAGPDRLAMAVPDGLSAPLPAPESDLQAGPLLAQVTFLRDAKGKPFWHKTGVRASLALAGLCLATALVLQVIVHQRDRMAVTMPAARPVLETLCGVLGCKISPLRQIESVVIEGSTFNELRGNGYRLGFTIKNTAPVDLAMPALELTLTDSQDRAALRRVFLPAEFGATSPVLAAGAEWAGTLAVSVRTSGSSERIAGYRILTLYP
jgi:predicted Zn finger-like uncharacterized protein